MSEYYKVLNADGSAYHGGFGTWHLPTADGPGEWMPTIDDPTLCERGYHGCRRGDLVQWLGPVMYEMEYDGPVIEGDDKVVGSRARLLRRIDAWDDRTARLFACDCAERAVNLTGPDPQCVAAIETARRYAAGEATKEEFAAARSAGWAAARNAARAAAGAAAAAGDAARDAARGAERAWQTERLFEYLEGDL